jgi:hypothetical protein
MIGEATIRDLRELPGDAPPRGALFPAEKGAAALGGAARRPLDPAICEMKPLYVRRALYLELDLRPDRE